MRVISGKAKGLKLTPPKDLKVRPTADRIKEAIFSSIQNHIDGSIALDLFAGTGSLGIEALSRGAKKAYFVDYVKESIENINDNLTKTKLIQDAEVLFMDATLAIAKMSREGVKLDVIFLDPPYGKGLVEKIMIELIDNNLVKQNTIIITEHEIGLSLSEKIKSFDKYKEKKYGKIMISFYRNEEEA